ncbi:hypothetical protein O6H91_18G043200 [Diphasiastrum complanatum]|uniref:Uncharacterized protein n=1 Tax=Diphasiastrum complanatum TaxID=34168 RepID=A0ACC2B0G9_DIPCM|nr:hypothetical protein O6H91_18G043200 [Diphasiastrum complanatum]
MYRERERERERESASLCTYSERARESMEMDLTMHHHSLSACTDSRTLLSTTQGRACLPSFTSTATLHSRPSKSSPLCDNFLGCSTGAFISLVKFSVVAQSSFAIKRINPLFVRRAAYDTELLAVLELASEAELCELSEILYGCSLLSPILKSVTSGNGLHSDNVSDPNLEKGGRGRDALLKRLESRFLYLAADAKATLSGRRPMYRDVLLLVRKKLNVPCSQNLATEDMEAEIFLHLLREYSRPEFIGQPAPNKLRASYINDVGTARAGQWHGYTLAAVRLGMDELCTVLLKGGGALTMSTLQKIDKAL